MWRSERELNNVRGIFDIALGGVGIFSAWNVNEAERKLTGSCGNADCGGARLTFTATQQ